MHRVSLSEFVLTTSLLVVLFFSLARKALATDVPGGSVDVDTTWTVAGSPYVVQGTITVDSGATLTIEAGVTVQFSGAYSLQIGGATSGTLVAVGTTRSPILFETDGTVANWRSIVFGSTSASSQMVHCILDDGGFSVASVLCSGSSPSLSNLTINASGSDGIQLTTSNASLTNITVNGCSNDGFQADEFNGSISGLTVLQAGLHGVTLDDSQPAPFSDIVVDGFGNNSRGFEFDNSSPALTGTNSVSGGETGLYFLNASPSVSNLSLDDLTGSAVVTTNTTSTPTFSSVSLGAGVTELGQAGADVWANFLSSLLTVAGSGYFLEVHASTLTVPGTTSWGQQSYLDEIHLLGNLNIQGGGHPILVFGAGTTVKVDGGSTVFVASSTEPGSLRVEGTETQPVRFERLDGNPWGSIYFRALAGPTSSLQQCQLIDGGASIAALRCTESSPSFSDVTISASGSDGIQLSTSNASLTNITVNGCSNDGLQADDFDGSISGLTLLQSGLHGVTLDDSQPAPFSDIVVDGFGINSRGFEFDNSSPALTGTNSVSGGETGLYFLNASPFLSNLSLDDLTGSAVVTTNTASTPTFSNVSLGAGVAGLGRASADVWASFLSSLLTVAGSGYFLEVHASTLTVPGTTSWGQQSYLDEIHLLGNLNIRGLGHPILVFGAGTTVKVDGGSTVFVASSTEPGSLRVEGTGGQPVRFERLDGTPWGSIYFRALAGPTSSLQQCQLIDGGASIAALRCTESSPSFSDVTITASSSDGIQLSTSNASLTSITVNGCENDGLQADEFNGSISGLTVLEAGLHGVTLDDSQPAPFSDIVVDGFGINSRGFEFDSSSPALTGSNSVTGGNTGLYFQASSPSLSGLFVDNVTESAFEATTDTSDPTFDDLTLGAGVAALGQMTANSWASFFNSLPLVSGSGYRPEILASTLSLPGPTNWGGQPFLDEIHLLGSISIEGSGHPHLTLEPGTTVRIKENSSVTIGNDAPGTLQATGTSSEPVRFERLGVHRWGSIRFRSKSGIASGLVHCVLTDGGHATAALSALDCSPAISDVSILQSGDDGVDLEDSWSSLTGLTVDGALGRGVELTNWRGSLTDVTVLGVTSDGIYLVDSELNGVSEVVVDGFGGADTGLHLERTDGDLSGPIDVHNGGKGVVLQSRTGLFFDLSVSGVDLGIEISGDGEAWFDTVSLSNCQDGISALNSVPNLSVTSGTFVSIPGTAVACTSDTRTAIHDSTFTTIGRGVLTSHPDAWVRLKNCQFNSWIETGLDSRGPTEISQSQFTGAGTMIRVVAATLHRTLETESGNSFNPTGVASLGLYTDELLTSTVWQGPAGVSIQLLEDVSFAEMLTIREGTTVLFDPGRSLIASERGNPARFAPLIVAGTAASPIVFRASDSVAGAGGILRSGTGSVFQHSEVDALTSLLLRGDSVVRDSLVHDTTGPGIQVLSNSDASSSPYLSRMERISVENCGSDGIQVTDEVTLEIQDSSFTGNNGYALHTLAGGLPGPTVRVDQTNLFGNGVGGVLAEEPSLVNATYSYWGDAEGPGGEGEGGGDSIQTVGSAEILFDPWFATEITNAFHIGDPFVGPGAIPPVISWIHFRGIPTAAADWQLSLFDDLGVKVFERTGTSAIDYYWDGTNNPTRPPDLYNSPGTTPGRQPLSVPGTVRFPDGDYTFRLFADDTANPGQRVTLRGSLELDSDLLVARISDPTDAELFAAEQAIDILGTATGSQFDRYLLEFGLGSQPSSYTVLTDSQTPVTDGTLGSVTLPICDSGFGVVRLTVSRDVPPLVEAMDSVGIRLFALRALNLSSPSFDPVRGEALTVSSSVTWSSSWNVEVFLGANGPLWSEAGTGTQVLALWDGDDSSGNPLPAGDYTVRTTAGSIEDPTVSVTRDLPVTLNRDPGITLVEPNDGELVSATESVTVTTSLGPGSYDYLLEVGTEPFWETLLLSSNLSNLQPFLWDVRSYADGPLSLRATAFLPNGETVSDIHSVAVRNPILQLDRRVIDPLVPEPIEITVSDTVGAGSDGLLEIEVYEALTSYTPNLFEGQYDGYASTVPIWTGSEAFVDGAATVTWHGEEASGLPSPAGEYIVKAIVNYDAGGLVEHEAVPGLNPQRINETLAGVAVFPQADLFVGEQALFTFSLLEPAWIMLMGSGADPSLIFPKGLYDVGRQEHWWDGMGYEKLHLVFPEGTSSTTPRIKAVLPPKGLMSLENGSLVVEELSIDPPAIVPMYGQISTIRYSVNRQADVTVEIYSTEQEDPYPLYRDLQPLTTIPAGTLQSLSFDGLDDSGRSPAFSGNYTVHIVARDPQYPSYRDEVRMTIRLIY